MKRNIKKTIEGYRNLSSGSRSNESEGSFYMDDIQQIVDLAREKYPDLSWDLMFKAVSYGLEAGFEIGYRKAKRDLRSN